MAKIHFINPVDPPSGKNRLLNYLISNLNSKDFTEFNLAVAFAKIGPLKRLEPHIKIWKESGNRISAIFGIDHCGTSVQALDFALENFDEVYITHTQNSTFHPKFYIFHGHSQADCYYGSSNLTIGGTETNFEGGVKISINILEEPDTYNEALNCFQEILTLKSTTQLDRTILDFLHNNGYLFDESKTSRKASPNASTSANASEIKAYFGEFFTSPPSPLPKEILKSTSPVTRISSDPITLNNMAQSLIIQINPHHNGEVFLSKTAVNQNPSFFGFPFMGKTIPKYQHNASYPQRSPDPKVNFVIFNHEDNIIMTKKLHSLNMVFYDKKSEIRIQFPVDIKNLTPPSSIMHLSLATSGSNYDYDIFIYQPGSSQYSRYLSSCNQTLPSGGGIPRKMGWI